MVQFRPPLPGRVAARAAGEHAFAVAAATALPDNAIERKRPQVVAVIVAADVPNAHSRQVGEPVSGDTARGAGPRDGAQAQLTGSVDVDDAGLRCHGGGDRMMCAVMLADSNSAGGRRLDDAWNSLAACQAQAEADGAGAFSFSATFLECDTYHAPCTFASGGSGAAGYVSYFASPVVDAGL